MMKIEDKLFWFQLNRYTSGIGFFTSQNLRSDDFSLAMQGFSGVIFYFSFLTGRGSG
jgi:hypothetical protein